MNGRFVLVALAVWLGVASSARADGMRCGSQWVSDGDSKARVQSRCGTPEEIETWVEYRTERVWVGNAWIERSVEVKYERWTYERGADRLVRFVVFQDGRLLRVDTGPRGER